MGEPLLPPQALLVLSTVPHVAPLPFQFFREMGSFIARSADTRLFPYIACFCCGVMSPDQKDSSQQYLTRRCGMQAKAHPETDGVTWPVQYKRLLDCIGDHAFKSKAAAFFLAALHPEPSQRLTAAQALHFDFLQ